MDSGWLAACRMQWQWNLCRIAEAKHVTEPFIFDNSKMLHIATEFHYFDL